MIDEHKNGESDGAPSISSFHTKKKKLITSVILLIVLVIAMVVISFVPKQTTKRYTNQHYEKDKFITATNYEIIIDNTSHFLVASTQVTSGAPSILSMQRSSNSCPSGQGLWNMKLTTDWYGYETKWSLYNSNNERIAHGPPEPNNYEDTTTYQGNLCLPIGIYHIKSYDLSADGICCTYGNGSWIVKVNGIVVLQSSDDDNYKEREYTFSVTDNVDKPTPPQPPVMSLKSYRPCLTESSCQKAAANINVQFYKGTFQTKGCFTKTNNVGIQKAYFSNGGSFSEMVTEDLPSNQARLWCGEQETSSSSSSNSYDAVIVGAGWSGISAARTLIDRGINNILILEASDYIGGRSKTINMVDDSINNPQQVGNYNNVPLDFGSEWQYDDNGLEAYLRRSGLLDGVDLSTRQDGYLTADNTQYYMSNTNGNAQVLTNAQVNELRRSWKAFLRYKPNWQSYYDAAEQYKAEYLQDDNQARQFINLMASTSEISYSGDKDELLDWKSMRTGDFGNAEYYISYRGVGYGNLAAKVAAPFQSKIKLNSKVFEINSEEDKPYQTIKYIDENGYIISIKAKTTLVTVSLGVLKSKSIRFVPTLPSWKEDVINNMGFGIANKCIMLWEDNRSVVWPVNKPWFQLITPTADSSGRYTTFFNPTQFKDKAVLVGWTAAQDARDMETQTDEKILDEVMRNLQIMYPTITRPDKVFITRWGKDPNVLGAYSFQKLRRNFANDSFKLRQRVGGVSFAGEATSGAYGTVTGAWESGQRAAYEMINIIRPPPPSPPPPRTYMPTYYPTFVPTDD